MKAYHLGLAGSNPTGHSRLVTELEGVGCRVDLLPEPPGELANRLRELKPHAILYMYNENSSKDAPTILADEKITSLVPFVLMVEDESAVSQLPVQALHTHGVLFHPFHIRQIIAMVELAIHLHSQERMKDVMLTDYVESLRNVNEAVILSDPLGQVMFVNEKALRLTGYEDAIKRRVDQVFRVDDGKGEDSPHPVISAMQSTLNGHGSFHTTLITRSEEKKPIRCQVRRIDRGATVLGACLLFHEIQARESDKVEISLQDTAMSVATQQIVEKVNRVHPDVDGDIRVKVRTYGEFSLIIDGSNIETNKWRSKKALDVFCYLLLHYSQPVHKEVLIDFLWPNLDSHTGNRRLLNAISELRKYLEPGAKRYSRNSFVRHESGVYRLDFGDNVYIDTLVFRELVRNGDYQWATGQQRVARTFYLEALQHKDGQFLPRYLYEREFEETREQYEIS
ncbi:MAG TPA: PAS domain-containing protein, partial [Bacteroidetes bacterium]|nr:PAS domain-containing protein [Bacteroidota bacterium]HEX04605.1 PAS domain-containing protein [Bacteroidota bacterium]